MSAWKTSGLEGGERDPFVILLRRRMSCSRSVYLILEHETIDQFEHPWPLLKASLEVIPDCCVACSNAEGMRKPLDYRQLIESKELGSLSQVLGDL